MNYKNIKTGAKIFSPCNISGGDWIELKPGKEPETEINTKPKKDTKKKEPKKD